MFFKLLLLFIFVPILEMAILIKLGQMMGLAETILLVIITGVVGAGLVKLEGAMVWKRLQKSLRAGEMPTEALLDGFLVFVAGVVMITPGLLTDIGGLFLLFPLTRGMVKKWLKKKFRQKMEEGTLRTNFTMRSDHIPPGQRKSDSQERDLSGDDREENP